MIIGEKMDKLLQPQMVEYIMFQKSNPQLNILGMFNKQNLQGDTYFEFATKRTNTQDDIMEGILHEPVEVGEGSEYPQVQVRGIQEEVGNTTKLGFEVEFSEELVKSDKNLAYVQNTLADMGYAMNRAINRFGFQELMNSATKPAITPKGGSWADEGNEEIDEDVKTFQRWFKKQSGYSYTLTDMFTSFDSYWGAEDYYDAVRVNGFDPNNVRNSRLKGIEEFESGMLGMDANVNSAIWFYNVNPEENTLHDANGSFINVNRFENDEKHPKSLGFQLTTELGMAVLEPRSIIYVEGV